MNYSVKVYFEVYPQLKEAFETYDGVLHPTREVAEKWVERHTNKTITTWPNPAHDQELVEDQETTGNLEPEEPSNSLLPAGDPKSEEPTSGNEQTNSQELTDNQELTTNETVNDQESTGGQEQ